MFAALNFLFLLTTELCIYVVILFSISSGAASGSLNTVCRLKASNECWKALFCYYGERQPRECLNLSECLGKHEGANKACGYFHRQQRLPRSVQPPASVSDCRECSFYIILLNWHSISVCTLVVQDVFICYNSQLFYLKRCRFLVT